MNVLVNILLVVTAILAAYAGFPLASMLLSLFVPYRKAKNENVNETNFACIITAYGNAAIAIEQVNSLLQQSHQKFRIYVVADNCIDEGLFAKHDLLTVIYPQQALHSKIKSIKAAIEAFTQPHNFICILDADNLLHPQALENLAIYARAGYKAIQGQRTAKNLDTHVAALDALSEIYYNTTQRLTAFKIGSSATIAGSGMAIEAFFFKNYVDALLNGSTEIILAEDKLLQMMLIDVNERIAYCREALIFDEKVREGAQVQRQRTRWLRSWFDHWGAAIKIALKGISKLSWNQFYFGLMLSFPPMVLLVAALVLMIPLGLLFNTSISLLALAGILLFAAGFVVALLVAPAPASVWKAIPYIPYFAARQILAILNIKTSSKDFMATKHTQYLSINEVWAQRKKDFPYLKN